MPSRCCRSLGAVSIALADDHRAGTSGRCWRALPQWPVHELCAAFAISFVRQDSRHLRLLREGGSTWCDIEEKQKPHKFNVFPYLLTRADPGASSACWLAAQHWEQRRCMMAGTDEREAIEDFAEQLAQLEELDLLAAPASSGWPRPASQLQPPDIVRRPGADWVLEVAGAGQSEAEFSADAVGTGIFGRGIGENVAVPRHRLQPLEQWRARRGRRCPCRGTPPGPPSRPRSLARPLPRAPNSRPSRRSCRPPRSAASRRRRAGDR